MRRHREYKEGSTAYFHCGENNAEVWNGHHLASSRTQTILGLGFWEQRLAWRAKMEPVPHFSVV